MVAHHGDDASTPFLLLCLPFLGCKEEEMLRASAILGLQDLAVCVCVCVWMCIAPPALSACLPACLRTSTTYLLPTYLPTTYYLPTYLLLPYLNLPPTRHLRIKDAPSRPFLEA